jgi:hypothetical protein
MHRARYCLGHTHEVICPACLGMDAGPKPRALGSVDTYRIHKMIAARVMTAW